MAIEEADSDEAPGWAAIDRALEPVYAGRQPKHWGTIVPFALGGDDPLDGAFTISTEESGDFTTLRIALTAEKAATLAGLVRPIAGTHSHPALPGLVIVVERSYIRTPEGEILETIG